MTLLAEEAEDAGKVARLEAVDYVGRTRALLRHAHVERSVGAEREAAPGLVELHRRDADVEHHPVDLFGIVVEPGERSVHQPQPAAGRRFHVAPGSDRVGVAVDRHHRGARLENRLGVTACAEGAVYEGLTLAGCQRGKHFGQKYRNVTGRSANRGAVPAVTRHHSGCPPGFVPCRSLESLARTSAP